ncbi:MAG: phosphotransferase [Novosphingobium sp.]|nr:phosphotransferase [Novosphingobium sp.]
MTSDNPIPLPLTLEDLTTDWLQAALRSKTPGVGLRDSEIVDVNHGTCTKVRIRLDLDDAGKAAGIPELVILKGGFEAHSRMMPYMHKQEVHAYADVLPHTPLRFPACYFAGFDKAAAQGIIIMEDLVARGVDFCHPQKPQEPGQVERRLTMLARHHAMTWGEKDLKPGGRFDWATSTADSTHFDSILVPDVWQSYIDSARGAAASVCFHDLDWMRRANARLSKLTRSLPNVLIHGDTHLGNLYIDTDGEPGFFDSLPHRSAIMYEVSYHVTGALDVPVRRRHERALVSHYRDELIRCGVDAPPLDELMHQFGCFLANGYMIFIVNASEFQPEAINTAYTARFSSAMLDHDTIGLIEALPD